MLMMTSLYTQRVFLRLILLCSFHIFAFNVMEFSHYIDYLPHNQDKYFLTNIEDFRTMNIPSTHIRDRKVELGPVSKLSVEEVLKNPIWPAKWPYGFEDFRPWDYTKNIPFNTMMDYAYGNSLYQKDQVSLFPDLRFLKFPIRRNWIRPKEQFALAEHMSQYFFDGCSVLEIGSTYESFLPTVEYGPVVGIGWHPEELAANIALDDYILQDFTVDPYFPLSDNFFDFVVMPANFQLIQRPKIFFQEVNRVLKPGGMAMIGVKEEFHDFLIWKQGRYYAETNVLEDILALGSFFHYAKGFSKPESYDLNLPECHPVGKLKDLLFPNPRLDFYSLVQAKKKKNSPHGQNTVREREGSVSAIKGVEYMPRGDYTTGSYY